jgi:predicted nucleic acid-binding protein
MRVFWDTNLFIYLIERHPVFHTRVLDLYRDSKQRGDVVVTSALTLGELMAQPLRLGRMDLVDRYAELLSRGRGIELIEFGQPAAEQYARIRAGTSLRQPDAIQFACAIAGGASVFVTNDQRLWNVRVTGLESVRGL